MLDFGIGSSTTLSLQEDARRFAPVLVFHLQVWDVKFPICIVPHSWMVKKSVGNLDSFMEWPMVAACMGFPNITGSKQSLPAT